jgi:oligoendopeptidase F
MADYLGYGSYVDFAYEYYYSRDYTPEQVMPYLDAIQQELVPLYRQQDRFGSYSQGGRSCSEDEMFSYVRKVANEMGGTVAEAFETMEQFGVYNITYSEKKYDSSFETYLYNYEIPFVFVNPVGNQWDKLTFAHEFGHFANDYASYGNSGCVDVAEFFSQGFEYLSLCYGSRNRTLTQMKLADCLFLTVEQSAYAAFEHQLYALGDEELTEEGVRSLYAQVCTDYGFDSWGFDSQSYVTINHFFTNPLYIISYVVSNDAAFQLYQLEQAEPGAGLELYESYLDNGSEHFLEFVEETGLESPFDAQRVTTIRETLEKILTQEGKGQFTQE